MLRASSEQEGTPATLRGVVDRTIDLGVTAGRHLRDLATAVVARHRRSTEASRAAVVETLGEEAALTAIGVVANFQMMNRALDAIGIPATLDHTVATDLGIDVDTFGGAHGPA